MARRLTFPLIVFALGILSASLIPGVSVSVRRMLGFAPPPAVVAAKVETPGKAEAGNQFIKLTDEQLDAAKITLAPAASGTLAKRILVPGTIVPLSDNIARVSVRVSAIVLELHKRLGDSVAKDEIVAVLESREVADAKSEYLATKLTHELQDDLTQRDKALWERNNAPEQQYLRSRNLASLARVRFDIARQKLLALGVSEGEITALPTEPEGLLRRQTVRAPLAGRIVERKVDLGSAVGRDNLETELFVIADLSRVWIELAVSPSDLPAVKEGQTVAITARPDRRAEGAIVFISPMLDKDSRAARVVAEIDNADGNWRPGSFITAAIAVATQAVEVAVPNAAVQAVGTEKFVFVRAAEGFEKRMVVTGRADTRVTEIVSGLKPGEVVAASNTYVLKAEALKRQAED